MPSKTVAREFWTGPYGMLVPVDTLEVVDEDGLGNYPQEVSRRRRISVPRLTKKEYLQRYARLGEDGRYYWLGNPDNL